MTDTVDLIGWFTLYVVGAIATLFIAGWIAEEEKGGVRKWWATIAACFLIWPLAWPAAILYAIGLGCFKASRYFWRMRNWQ
jgi:hypothetical protein